MNCIQNFTIKKSICFKINSTGKVIHIYVIHHSFSFHTSNMIGVPCVIYIFVCVSK